MVKLCVYDNTKSRLTYDAYVWHYITDTFSMVYIWTISMESLKPTIKIHVSGEMIQYCTSTKANSVSCLLVHFAGYRN